MRLEPIEKPRSLLVRFAFWLSRRQLGKVMTPLKVIYARMPKLLMAQRKLYNLMEDDTLEPELRALISTHISSLNSCGFCGDLHQAVAIQKEQVPEVLLLALPDFRTNSYFSTRQRAVLSFAEELTLEKDVSDGTFAAVQEHFDQTEIVFLNWYVAMINYLNLMARGLKIESDGFCELARQKRRPKLANEEVASV